MGGRTHEEGRAEEGRVEKRMGEERKLERRGRREEKSSGVKGWRNG